MLPTIPVPYKMHRKILVFRLVQQSSRLSTHSPDIHLQMATNSPLKGSQTANKTGLHQEAFLPFPCHAPKVEIHKLTSGLLTPHIHTYWHHIQTVTKSFHVILLELYPSHCPFIFDISVNKDTIN